MNTLYVCPNCKCVARIHVDFRRKVGGVPTMTCKGCKKKMVWIPPKPPTVSEVPF